MVYTISIYGIYGISRYCMHNNIYIICSIIFIYHTPYIYKTQQVQTQVDNLSINLDKIAQYGSPITQKRLEKLEIKVFKLN